jgi:LysM repeat protein/ABC-type branched-subunit amino acid transport system substrate-binding protein
MAQQAPKTHFVQKGETLYSLSKAYEVTIDALLDSNPDLKSGLREGMVITIPGKANADVITAPTVSYGSDSSDAHFYYHTVQPRQTLFGLTKSYDVALEAIEAANPDLARLGLQIGSVIKIPRADAPKSTSPIQATSRANGDTIICTVQAGETVYSLCRTYNVNADVFFKLNPHTVDGLKEGQEVRIPGKSSPPSDAKPKEKQYLLYQIKPGDTLEKIIKDHQTNAEALFELNPELREGLITNRYIIIPPKGYQATSLPQTTIRQEVDDRRTPIPVRSAPIMHRQQKRIAVLLPFDLPPADPVDEDLESDEEEAQATPKNRRTPARRPDLQMSLEFYAGFKLALQELANTGFDIDLTVLNAKAEDSELAAIQRTLSDRNVQFVVGPLYARQATQIASALNSRQIPVFSPLSRGIDNSKNENLVACIPAKQNEYLRIAEAFNRELFGSCIVFVNPDSPQNRAAVKAIRKAMHARDSGLVREIWSDRARDLGAQINDGQQTVFVTVDQNKAFLTDLVSKLFVLRDKNVRLVSTTDLFQIETIEIRYLNQIHYTTTELFYVDYKSPEVVTFVKAFRETYHTEPSRFAFQGYDLGQYLARLEPHQTTATKLPTKRGLSSGFIFDSNANGGPQNRFVFLMELRDMEFRPLSGN